MGSSLKLLVLGRRCIGVVGIMGKLSMFHVSMQNLRCKIRIIVNISRKDDNRNDFLPINPISSKFNCELRQHVVSICLQKRPPGKKWQMTAKHTVNFQIPRGYRVNLSTLQQQKFLIQRRKSEEIFFFFIFNYFSVNWFISKPPGWACK